MATPLDSESVEYNILLNAQQALKELQEFNRAAIDSAGKVESLEARIRNFERVVADEARKANVAFEQQLATFERLDAKLRQSRKATIFGGTDASLGVDPFAETQVIHDRRLAYEEQQNAAKKAFAEENALRDQEITGLTNATKAHQTLGNSAEEAGKKSTKASQSTVAGINLVKTALHILVASAIFAVINAFQQLFSMAIKGLRELETATYNLVNAERTLSEQGIAITPQGLDETIKKLQEIDPLLSRIQATESVSRVATLVAPAVGLKANEIAELSQAIAILAVRNKGLGKSFEEVESQVSNAFLSGRVSVGINQLGVKITDQIVKDEALRLGLVKTGEEFDTLTGKIESNVKARAMLSILTQNTAKDVAHLPEYFKTADAQFTIFQARLQDLFTIIGRDMGPALITIFDFLAKAISGWIIILEKLKPVIQGTVALFVGLGEAIKATFKTASNPKEFRDNIFNAFKTGVADTKKYFTEFSDAVDTATNSVDAFASSTGNMSKATEEAKDKLADLAKEMKDKAADIERNYKDKLADIATDYADKIVDINSKAADKRADAEMDLGNKLADINRDSSSKVADAQAEFRQKEIDREKEKNDKLKELRRKFLMDLEDALRERDARAVLKLIRNYNAEKKAAEEANKQKAQQDKQELQRKLQDIEIERQQKIDAARREYADKLKEIELAQQRELAEAQVWRNRELRDAEIQHQRQLEEQRIYLQRKLRDLADAIAKEYQLTASGSAAILRLIQTYFGAAGSAISGLSGQLGSVSIGTSGGTGIGTSSSGSIGNTSAGIGSGLYNPYDIRSRGTGFAEGGTLLATRPTTVTFGETPEIATFTPITRSGQNTNDLVTSLGGQGTGGSANITLKLSPDLRAEIVESSLENVAVHLERLTRNE